jgi:GTP cyclohydrolase I
MTDNHEMQKAQQQSVQHVSDSHDESKIFHYSVCEHKFFNLDIYTAAVAYFQNKHCFDLISLSD